MSGHQILITNGRTHARTGVTLNAPPPFFEWRGHKKGEEKHALQCMVGFCLLARQFIFLKRSSSLLVSHFTRWSDTLWSFLRLYPLNIVWDTTVPFEVIVVCSHLTLCLMLPFFLETSVSAALTIISLSLFFWAAVFFW